MTVEMIVQSIVNLIDTLTMILLAILVTTIVILVFMCLIYNTNRVNIGGFKKSTRVKEKFLKSQNVGKEFVWLIKNGVFQSLKTGNHGDDFPEKKQTENFKKYATSAIAEKVFSLEVSHEESII